MFQCPLIRYTIYARRNPIFIQSQYSFQSLTKLSDNKTKTEYLRVVRKNESILQSCLIIVFSSVARQKHS